MKIDTRPHVVIYKPHTVIATVYGPFASYTDAHDWCAENFEATFTNYEIKRLYPIGEIQR